jgi:hypothetical protein
LLRSTPARAAKQRAGSGTKSGAFASVVINNLARNRTYGGPPQSAAECATFRLCRRYPGTSGGRIETRLLNSPNMTLALITLLLLGRLALLRVNKLLLR